MILYKHQANFEVVITAQRKSKSEKQSLLKGRHSIATKEIVNLIRAEEAKIKAWQKKTKPKRKRNTTSGNIDAGMCGASIDEDIEQLEDDD